ncbi:BTAD domain-containing putative transcriptional regulator [Mycobacterium sp. 663a-19]|uniref:BTAD domain-containing putative transcriptional regulator n=1 Tax=Mycobacterium sp. 663a-19 TaxID=2986148 RepID=UPI002D1F790E|nr:BTAD domain-containing putative transcriptional regulator [Mycobacterium sp. 663a-19]MEB3979898.1 BTAD domain-containing putative transcriptional regulator [Mycobacterium sp. 663a-19]
MELGVLGPLQVRQGGVPVAVPGAKPRAILTMLGLHGGSVVSADTLVELLWGEDPPRTAAKALQTHISSLRRVLGDGFVLTAGAGWTLAESDVDALRYKAAARLGRDAAAAGDTSQAVARFEEALALWRGIPELPDGRRGTSEKTRWIEGHAALVEDRADALLATGRAAEIIGELEAAVAEAPLRERRWGQLMLALYRAGRQGEALGAYQRARSLLADELGVDPGPDLRRLEAAIVAQDTALEIPAAQQPSVMTRAVTFLLTDIEGSTAAWEADAGAMAVALARHDELVEQVVTSRGGRLIKTRGEGDATFSVFERPSAAAAAAIELQEAIFHEPWALAEPMRVRVALHTGEAELRDGDYFGRAVNRAARLRSLAVGGQILCSGATAELVIDSLPDDVLLADLGMRELRNLARPEHVFELRLETADDHAQADVSTDEPVQRPSLPAVLAGPGPFVGRGRELERLFSAWQRALAGGTNAVLIAGEPGVGKTRLAGEFSRQAYDQGALVIYGRCDEDLGAPYQPFAEALRSLVPCMGSSALRGLRGVEALLPLVPGLSDALPDIAMPTRADPDTERYALFDAVVALLGIASAGTPVVLILDDLHWAAKPTLLLLRHLLRFGEHARVQIVGTYRSTDLDRSHPLAAMLADLHRDGTADRLQLGGLDEDDVTAYVAEAGYNDEELARALAAVTGGNPFFLIEALRHVDESGGRWDQSTLPQGVREAVSRRLSRLPAETNKALAAAAVVGSRFALELVERVVGDDLVDAFDEACKAGIVIEEPGGRYRFNHAIVRQSLLAELPSVRRMRLHQRIAATLESEAGDDDELLAELAHHYFECAWAGNAAKAVEYCRRAADQAMTRLAYEGAADLYDRALHALEEIDEELPDRDDQVAELLIARCEALLAAGDVASAAGAVSQLQGATIDSARLAAWATCFDGQLSMLSHPERLDEVEAAVGAAASKLAELNDAAGEAKAHTVRAGCLARLGRIGDCEIALDDALTAARRAREHRRVNAVLANAPLAALWGPNPVPRAGGRCLDVVRLLRITTDSPAVEATSTRCQAVLEAFRGRAAAARRMIDSARRTVTELGLRHAFLEVEQFAGIVELVLGDPAAAEPHLRKAYNGFRRMRLDADTAETAALLGRACLVLGREAEADELCTESERLAGHALKASIAWRTLRAQLLARRGDHAEARRAAEEAVSVAGHTDLLVDHGDACHTLATVLGAAGDAAGARAAAGRAVDLYERKGAAALAERARRALGERAVPPTAPAPPEKPVVDLDNACVRVTERVLAAIHSEAWDALEELYAPEGLVESRRKIVGFTTDLPPADWAHLSRRSVETGDVRFNQVVIAVRGEHLALAHLVVGSNDVSPGAPRDEFLSLNGIDESGRIAQQVWFDVEDMDAAIAELDAAYARFEAEHPPARRLESAATRVYERLHAYFKARDWDAIAKLLTDDYCGDDRRSVVGVGIRRGPDAAIEDYRSAADIEVTDAGSEAIAIRGARLALTRARYSRSTLESETFRVDFLQIVEIDADERIKALIAFDLEDFDAAIAELDARYLAGEAASHARTWSVVAGGYAGVNRHELPPTTPDFVSVDHRRGAKFAPGDLLEYLRAAWDLHEDITLYIEAVHRLTDLGAVVTQTAYGTSRDGFDAEWREVALFTADGDMFNHCELFDESDLDAAIAKFDQLSRPARRLENAASRADQRLMACVAARDWDAMAELLTDTYYIDDRRRAVNVGLRQGRDLAIAGVQALTDLGLTIRSSDVIATRGKRLVLSRTLWQSLDPDQPSETFHTEVLNLVEIDPDERIAARVWFDANDFGTASAELDARYLAGEAAAYAHTWSVITQAYDALNRREMPPTTPDWVNIDHRHAASFAPGALPALLAEWQLASDVSSSIEVVHRLDDLGAVVSSVSHETSQEGFKAEWRSIAVITVDRDLVDRLEVFEEADLDAAIARFEELHPQPRGLENTASQTYERFRSYFAARDWDGMAKLLTADTTVDDHRRVVSAEIRRGRDVEIANMRAFADLGTTRSTATVIATRGERLVLCRTCIRGEDQQPGGFHIEMLVIVETSANKRILARVAYDPDDIDAAFEELNARYIAGEAAAHSHTWAVVAGALAAINRHEIPELTPDCVNIDHRRGATFASGDMTAYVHAVFDDAPDFTSYITVVHRLSDLGAVVTMTSHGTSRQGFQAEWREIGLLTFDGNRLNRFELFDETDLDAALTRFDELHPQVRRLENTASQISDRFLAHFAARDWDAMAEMTADVFSSDDRRRVVGAGLQLGRDVDIANMRAWAGVGIKNMTSDVIAIRGKRLVLSRTRFWGPEQRPDAFHSEVLGVIEIDAESRIVARVVFDANDIDAAFEEIDARYLSGEATAHAHTWSLLTAADAALNRYEIPAHTQDWVNIDHRRATAFAPGDLIAYLRAGWDFAQDMKNRILAVHRMTDLGSVVTHLAHGTSKDGSELEWREIALLTFEGDLISRSELFDEADLDKAIACFEELNRPEPHLENATSRLVGQFLAHFAARDWDAMAELLADDISSDDRRRVLNAGTRHGRDAEMANWHATGDVWMSDVRATVIATRGAHLALFRFAFASQEQEPEAFQAAALGVVETNDDNQATASIVFDVDDIDAAFEELDARYVAGEAAAYSQSWSVITRSYTAFNRHEFSAPDWVNIDHRRARAFAPGELTAYMHATWDLAPNVSIYVEAVHRLSNLGAVVTHVVRGTSREGFDAEWREVLLLTVEGDVFNRCEVFDEADIEAAIARFEKLHQPVPRLKNAASQVAERFLAHLVAGGWDAIAETFTADFCQDDRRRVVGAGLRRGRDAEIADLRAIADLTITNITSTVIATRGERLVLMRVCFSFRDQGPEALLGELLAICEINADERIVADVSFDLDDIDAAFEELDARYLAGEAAAHAQAWSVIARGYSAVNQHELPGMTPDSVYIDHRGVLTTETEDLTAYLPAVWDLTPDISAYVETVHRLSDLGAVVTHAAHGTSLEGFAAEWRAIVMAIVEGDVYGRVEVFDEADLDAALARFEELQPQARRLENAASRVFERFVTRFAARDWDALSVMLADDVFNDDRRRVVNAGARLGRDATIASMQASAALGVSTITSTIVATRGERLALSRDSFSVRDQSSETVVAEVLGIVEIDADERILARLALDLDDINAAFAELDARYLAGEAADHSHAWSVVARSYGAFNRREDFPTTADWVNIDHRQGGAFAPGDITAAIHALWDLMPNTSCHIEAVHRLTNLGAVVTSTTRGTSQEGFDAEWRQIDIVIVEGELVSRCEVFDEADLDAALARFEELRPAAPRLENAASQVDARLHAYFAARDWDAMAEAMTQDFVYDDRRRVASAGLRRGRDAELVNIRALVDLGATVTSTVMATRGERLVLTHSRFSGPDQRPEAFHNVMLSVVEIDADERVVARVIFDVNDIDAAFEELDARYIAGEAAPHAQTWSAILRACAALNRREIFATTADFVDIDHRSVAAIGSGDLKAYMRAALNDGQYNVYIEAVHRLSDLGAVVTLVSTGTSQEGFDGEWRMADIFAVEGDLISRCEIFDEADLDAALARFEELHTETRRLENAASRVHDRYFAYFRDRNWAAIAEVLSDDSFVDDRRRVTSSGFWDGRDGVITTLRALADGAPIPLSVIATRGERLALTHICSPNRNLQYGEFSSEMLIIAEIDTSERIAAQLAFDLDDIDAALAELDARYLAGEAAAHARAWSLIADGHAQFNRQELPATTADPVYIDHRPVVSIERGDLASAVRAVWDVTPTARVYVEAVHRLDELGAVATQVVKGTSQEGFDAEWRTITVFTFEGDLLSHYEVFDEADLDAALARFEELQPRAPRLENAAGRILERYQACFSAPDWPAMAELLADDIVVDDRRRVVNAGVRRGRDVHIADLRTAVEVGAKTISLSVIATRGERLALAHARAFNRDMPGEVGAEWLGVTAIDADERFVAMVIFDLDDIDAAYEELDARYLTGEAAPFARVWQIALDTLGEANRHEPGPMLNGFAYTDHRRVPFAPGDFRRAVEELWALVPDARYRITTVHALDAHGLVASFVIEGTDEYENELQWPRLLLLNPDEPRMEVYEEDDVDAALARFAELHPQAPRLENAATQVAERLRANFAARDWTARAELLTDDCSIDDRRRVVNAGNLHGRNADIANMRAIADLGVANIALTTIATRGERLALSRARMSGRDQRPGAFYTETLTILEIDTNNRAATQVVFDPDDIDAAFEELEARYLAGEAAAHARTWSVITGAYAAVNRHELPPTTPDWCNVDHRRGGRAFAPGDLEAYLHVTWDLIAPDVNAYVEKVHRLNDLGAVVTRVIKGASREGFDAEWREVGLSTVDSDRINRSELFDEADLDAALARFDELDRHTPSLENAATRARARTAEAINRRDVNGVLAAATSDSRYQDRRKGLRDERTVTPEVVRAVFEAPTAWKLEVAPLAIRGSRLALTRDAYRDTDDVDRPITAEHLMLTEVNPDGLVCNSVLFDPDDINGAFAELTARWIASGEVEHSQVIEAMCRLTEATNRHDWDAFAALSAGATYVNHRQLSSPGVETIGDHMPSIQMMASLVPDFWVEQAEVLTQSAMGVVNHAVLRGTSTDGVAVAIPLVLLMIFDAERVTRYETFDADQRDLALARFEELNVEPQPQ